jgi:hypothetical protein
MLSELFVSCKRAAKVIANEQRHLRRWKITTGIKELSNRENCFFTVGAKVTFAAIINVP